jgi:hypothetical protein
LDCIITKIIVKVSKKESSKAVEWRKKKSNGGKGKRYTQFIAVMVLMMVLIGFGGVTMGQMNISTYQSVREEESDEGISFEIKIPENGEKIRVEKEKVDISNVTAEAMLPIISSNTRTVAVDARIELMGGGTKVPPNMIFGSMDIS